MNYWTLYGTFEPIPDPANPPPACLTQVWVRPLDAREGIVSDVVDDGGVRVVYCFGVAYTPDEWPPEGSILVAGPHAPWQS